MRRLPVFLLLDCSESMIGDNHARLEEGLARIVQELRRDPHALETVYLSVIAFAGKPRTLVPLVELIEFCSPDLPIGSGTGLGKALTHLMREIDRSVIASSADRKGDWKPLVFLMTDGYPTEDVTAAVRLWNDQYRRKASLVAISIGQDADLATLRQLTDDVLVLEETSNAGLVSVIRWISQSIQAHSRALDTLGTPSALPSAETAGLKRIDLSKPAASPTTVDERFAIIVGQCQNRRLPYVLKFERVENPIGMESNRLSEMFKDRRYHFSAAYPLRRSYFEMSADDPTSQSSISADLLYGGSSCPHCSNPVGMAFCSCGGTFCISGGGEQTCPWCDTTGSYGAVGDGEADFEIKRTQG